MIRWSPPALALVVVAGCVGGAGLRSAPDAPDGGPAASVTALDGHGRERPLDSIPRRPTLLANGFLPGSPFGVFAGEAGPDLLAAVDRGRLNLDLEARRVPGTLLEDGGLPTRPGGAWRWSPSSPLDPGVSIAVAGVDASTGRAVGFALTVGTGDDAGGARPLASWPADGTSGVPVALPFVAVRFDGPLDGGAAGRVLRLDALDDPEPGTTRPIPVRQSRAACADLGWFGDDRHVCFVLDLDAPLVAPKAIRISLADGVLDAAGAPLESWEARFKVDDHRPRPPRVVPGPCFIDEAPVAGAGCLRADDDTAVLRVRLDGPARLFLEADDGTRLDAAVAPRGEAILSATGLGPHRVVPGRLQVVGWLGGGPTVDVTLATTEPLPTLSIDEVRADPEGPEPDQEYVELWNHGEDPVPLAGLFLADAPDVEGDALGDDAPVVPPDGRALVVADTFDPDHPADPPVPAGVALVRIGSSLASGGLSNGGEPLFLRDSERRRLSASPRTPAPRSGRCLVRVADDPRTGAESAFALTDEGGCTPGAPSPLR